MAGGLDVDARESLPDVTKAFTSFTETELYELKMFALHMSDIEELQLARQETMTMKLGASGAVLEGVDKERVAALMTAYRKLALLENDPGTFNKVRKLLGRHAHDAETQEAATILGYLKAIKDIRKNVRDHGRVASYIIEHDDGTSETLAPKVIIDWLVNGVVSHSDPEARERWDQLGGWESGATLMNVLVTVGDEIQIFRGLNTVVTQILDSPESEAVSGENE